MEKEELQLEIEKIQERNKRVELDKRWETSWTRRLCICALTYIVVILYSYKHFSAQVCKLRYKRRKCT